MANSKIAFVTRADGSALIITVQPVACGACKRMATMLVNRCGRTLCVSCDAAKL